MAFKFRLEDEPVVLPQAHSNSDVRSIPVFQATVEDDTYGTLQFRRELLGVFYLDPPTTPGPVSPPILVGHQLAPSSLTSSQAPQPTSEAHLSLSPSLLAGQGHHFFAAKKDVDFIRRRYNIETLNSQCP